MPGVAEILGRRRGENFPVASIVLPRPVRRHLLAFYGYARFVDQLGDAYDGDRLAALNWLETVTRAAIDGTPADHPLVDRAVRSVGELGLEARPLFDLIEANRRDQTVLDYPGFDDLAAYCRLSADPVGRLVLGAFGYRDPRRRAWSDAICTGLQLTEHCQDVAEDARAGRIYLPGDDRRRFEVEPADLLRTPAPGPLRALMAFEVARARRFFDLGRPLIGAVSGPARIAIAGFWSGGHAALDAIAARDFDVSAGAPRPRLLPMGRRLAGAMLPARDTRGRR